MYNHLPHIDPTRSLDGGHRAAGSEQAELRRLHREHVAALRARTDDLHDAPTIATHRIIRPVAAILALVGVRR